MYWYSLIRTILQINGIFAYCSEKGGFFDYIQFGFLETPVLKFDLEVGGNHSLEVNHSDMKFDLGVSGTPSLEV